MNDENATPIIGAPFELGIDLRRIRVTLGDGDGERGGEEKEP